LKLIAPVIPLGLLLATAGLLAQQPPQQQEDLSVLAGWMRFSDAPNALYHHLGEQAFAFLDARRDRVARLNTQSQWRERQEEVTATLNGIVGPLPERTPLNARVTGVVRREGYRFEKVVFESMPNFFVTGALFVPDGVQAKAPAILYLSGHSASGFRNAPYMTVILNLVKKGFVVFAVDPVGQGERYQYWDPERRASRIGEPTLEHSYPGAQCFITGSSLARYMIWDGMRAIDYLVSRPEVDPSRLGVTGRSGGGTQAAYIGAMDPRIKAAAPENYITTFRRLIESRGVQDAEQNFTSGIARAIDVPDLLVARAPRPTLMITTTRDMFSIQGAREARDEVAKAFKAFGADANFLMVEDDAPHASTLKNREALYAFFRKALDLPGPTRDEPVEIMPFEELNVTPTGQLATSLKGETIFSVNRAEARKRLDEVERLRSRPESHRRAVLASARELSGYRAPGPGTEAVFTGRWQRDGYAVEMYFIQGEGRYVVPFLVFVPGGGGPHPAVIYLHPDGKAADARPGGTIEDLVRRGYLVLAPDLVGLGEMGPGTFQGDASSFKVGSANYNYWFAAIQIGRSLTGIRAGDVVRTVNYLKGRADADVTRLAAVSRGELNAVLLHAAALDESIKQVALVDPLLSWSSIVLNEYYAPRYVLHAVAGSLGRYDLADLACTLAPRKLLALGPVDEMGKPAPPTSIGAEFAHVRAAYAAIPGASRALDVRPVRGAGQLGSMLAGWFER
jgi:cephalosporin-C deacetylase-like acetyl esterase